MQRQKRERNPAGPEQLDLREVSNPVGLKREERSGDQRREPRSDQRPRQQVHRDATRRKREQDQQVVGDDRRHAEPDARSGGEAEERDRVRERQRAGFGSEDIGVEQMRRVARQLVRDPGQPPDSEQGVVVRADLRPEVKGLRRREENGQDREEYEDRDQLSYGGLRCARLVSQGHRLRGWQWRCRAHGATRHG